MAKIRSRNKTSDKGKLHFYKGREPTHRELTQKNDYAQALVIDEVQRASTTKMRIVITWIPAGSRPRFRKSMDRLDPKLKQRGEVKFANTTPDERLDLYEDVLTQDVEFYDSFPVEIPNDVATRVSKEHRRDIGYWQSRYLYQLESLLRQAISDHTGCLDVIIDKPPFDVTDEIRHLCQILIDEGCQIQWVTISPSRHVPELQVHDFVAGMDYDLNTGQFYEDTRIADLTEEKQARYRQVVDGFKTKIRKK